MGVLTFIFANSLLRAEISSEQSAAVFSFLKIVLFFLPSLTHGMVRTLAHAAEFALLGAHFALLPRFLSENKTIVRGGTALLGLIVPFIDEGIQYFVPGRDASFLDILTDSVGYLVGTAVTSIFCYLLFRKKGERHV
jgi:VanZ family protein